MPTWLSPITRSRRYWNRVSLKPSIRMRRLPEVSPVPECVCFSATLCDRSVGMKDRSQIAEPARVLLERELAAPAPEAAGGNDRSGRSLSDIARERFMKALFDRQIEPGAFLSQGDLVKILG